MNEIIVNDIIALLKAIFTILIVTRGYKDKLSNNTNAIVLISIILFTLYSSSTSVDKILNKVKEIENKIEFLRKEK